MVTGTGCEDLFSLHLSPSLSVSLRLSPSSLVYVAFDRDHALAFSDDDDFIVDIPVTSWVWMHTRFAA